MFPRGVIAQRDLEHRRDRQPENSYDYLSYDGEQEQQSLEKREKIHLMGGNFHFHIIKENLLIKSGNGNIRSQPELI